MNSLQDLRETLDAHAADVHDDGASARTTAVRGRARVVRRRRAVAVAGGAAAVVAAVATLSVIPGDRDPAPADRELLGRVAPETLDSLGYTYHFARGVESGQERASVRLRASDEPRLLTWASDADRVVVDSNVEGYDTWSDDTDFDDYVLIPPVESGTWEIRAGGAAAAIAVYELGEERPPGVTVDGITFRDRYGDETLLDARIGAEGETDLTLEVAVPDGPVRVAEFCRGVPEDHVVNVQAEGRGAIASAGCADDEFDPAGGSATFFEPGDLGTPGGTTTIRTWVSRRYGGSPVAVEGARLGLAAYVQPPPVTTIAGWDVPDVLEREGHRWRYVESVVTAPGEDRLLLDRDWDRPTLVGVHTRGIRGPGGVVDSGRGLDATRNSGGGSSQSYDWILGPGRERFPVTVRRGLTDSTVLGVSLYEKVD